MRPILVLKNKKCSRIHARARGPSVQTRRPTHSAGCAPPGSRLSSRWGGSEGGIWWRSRASCASALLRGAHTRLRDPRHPFAAGGRRSGPLGSAPWDRRGPGGSATAAEESPALWHGRRGSAAGKKRRTSPQSSESHPKCECWRTQQPRAHPSPTGQQ